MVNLNYLFTYTKYVENDFKINLRNAFRVFARAKFSKPGSKCYQCH